MSRRIYIRKEGKFVNGNVAIRELTKNDRTKDVEKNSQVSEDPISKEERQLNSTIASSNSEQSITISSHKPLTLKESKEQTEINNSTSAPSDAKQHDSKSSYKPLASEETEEVTQFTKFASAPSDSKPSSSNNSNKPLVSEETEGKSKLINSSTASPGSEQSITLSSDKSHSSKKTKEQIVINKSSLALFPTKQQDSKSSNKPLAFEETEDITKLRNCESATSDSEQSSPNNSNKLHTSEEIKGKSKLNNSSAASSGSEQSITMSSDKSLSSIKTKEQIEVNNSSLAPFDIKKHNSKSSNKPLASEKTEEMIKFVKSASLTTDFEQLLPNNSNKPLTSEETEEKTKLKNSNVAPSEYEQLSNKSGPSNSTSSGVPSLIPTKNVKQELQKGLGNNNSTVKQPDAEKATSSQYSSLTPKSSPKNDELQMTPEFQQVLEAIKTREISQVRAALIKHRSVLHISPPCLQLIELSVHDALLSSNISILDLVYEHWATAVYTSSSDPICNLERVTKAMAAARESCFKFLIENKQVLVAEQCLFAYNHFRIQLHRQLSTSFNDQVDQLPKVLNVFTTIIDTYTEYSNKIIDLISSEVIDEAVYKSFADSNSLYIKYLLYDMFKLYYYKLDLCIAHLILKYLNSFKISLKLSKYIYNDIEYALYYFIHLIENDWRWLLKTVRIKQVVHEDPSDFYEFFIAPNSFLNGISIYLERMPFKEVVKKFRNELENFKTHSQEQDSEILFLMLTTYSHSKLPTGYIQNGSELLPYLRDVYSCKKIMLYLDSCSRVIQNCPRKVSVLIVQRILQVTTDLLIKIENLQLSKRTEALLHAHIPRTVLHQLYKLRGCFSRVSNANLSKRIDLEETHSNLLLQAANEIVQIKISLLEVINLYYRIIKKTTLQNGICLVQDKCEKYLDSINTSWLDPYFCRFHRLTNDELVTMMQGQDKIVNESLLKHGLTLQFYLGYAIIEFNDTKLRKHFDAVNYTENILKMFPVFVNYIENILADTENITFEKHILFKDTKKVPNLKYNIDDANIQTKSQHTSKTSNTSKTIIKSEWYKIYHLLLFVLEELRDFTTKQKLNIIFNELPDNKKKTDEIREVLIECKENCEILAQFLKIDKPKEKKTYKYKGIEQLTELMSNKIFLSKKEIEYLKSNIGNGLQDNKELSHSLILEKILKSEEISTEEQDTILNHIDMNDRCKDIIGKLVTGSKREECALQFLAIRATALKNAIAGNVFTQLVQRYKEDESFRLLVETLLDDIQNVFNQRGLQHLLEGKMTDMLNYPLQYVVNRGIPLQGLIVDTFESNELPNAFFRFAFLVVEDEPVFEKLWKLQEEGYGREEVKRTWSGPESPRLQHYFELLPKIVPVKRATEHVGNSNKDNTEKVLLKSSNTVAAINMPSNNVPDLTKLEQTSQTTISSSNTSTSSEEPANMSIAKISELIAAASAAATAAVTAASAASTAAQAAASAAAAVAEASAALVSFITSANTASSANDQQTIE